MHLGKTVLPWMKNVGKPYAGKLHVRFDEEGLGSPALYSTSNIYWNNHAPFDVY